MLGVEALDAVYILPSEYTGHQEAQYFSYYQTKCGMLGVEALDAVYSHQNAQVIKKLNTFLTIRLSVYASLAFKE